MPREVIVQNSCYEVYKMVARRLENVDEDEDMNVPEHLNPFSTILGPYCTCF